METTADVLEIPKKGEYGKGSIQQRGKSWQISFYDTEGRRRRETYSTEAKAKKALNQKLALKETGKLDPQDSRITVDALAALYLADRKGTSPKSIAWLRSVWNNHLQPFFEGYFASKIDTEKLIKFRNERLEAGASPTTVNKDLTVLRAIFYHGLNDYSPPKISRAPKFPTRLTEPDPRSGFVNDEQYDALQENCKDAWLRALLAMAYTYGFRKGELVGHVQRKQPPMLVSQLDMKNRTINLDPGTTKNREGRIVKMTQEVYDYLRVCVEGKTPDEAVFTWENGRRVKDFRETWDQLTDAAKVPNLLLHDFRRSAARNLLRAGVNRDVAKRITGHKTDSMFSRYNIVAEEDLVEAATKLEQRRASQSNTNQSTAQEEIGRRTVAEATQSSESSVNY